MVLTDDVLDKFVNDIQSEIDNEWTYGAIGSDDSAPSDTDDSLGNEVLRKARQDYSESGSESTISLFVATTEANGNDINEVGLFDSSSNGEMKFREVFNSISKSNEFELWFDVKASVSAKEV